MNKKIFIDYNTGNIVDASGAKTMSKQNFYYGEKAIIEFHFVDSSIADMAQVNLSGITNAICGLDNDFVLSTSPMAQDDAVDCTAAESGIFTAELDTQTDKFLSVVTGKQNAQCILELRGKDVNGDTILVSQLNSNAVGAIYLGNS